MSFQIIFSSSSSPAVIVAAVIVAASFCGFVLELADEFTWIFDFWAKIAEQGYQFHVWAAADQWVVGQVKLRQGQFVVDGDERGVKIK